MSKSIIKIAAKVIFLIVITIIATAIVQSPVITNDLAMTQMQNSDDLYIAVSVYEKFIPVANFILTMARLLIAFSIGNDIYKLVNKEKEN